MADDADGVVALRWKISKAIRSCAPFLTEQCTEEMANRVLQRLQDEYGGSRLYIPCKSKEDRDTEIVRAFNGSNRIEVCARFNISERSLYSIVRKKRQG